MGFKEEELGAGYLVALDCPLILAGDIRQEFSSNLDCVVFASSNVNIRFFTRYKLSQIILRVKH